MTNEEAANWLLSTLAGETGGEPLSVEDGEVRAVEPNETLALVFNAHTAKNRLLISLPEEGPNGEVRQATFAITVERVHG